MEGLQRRFKETTHPEDEAEFLDEQQQEQLLQELREQNDKSNLSIQRGIVFIDILVSTIYAIFFYDLATAEILSVPRIPVPLMEPVAALIPVPEFAAMMSIASLYASVYTFITACRLSALEVIWKQPPPGRGLAPLNVLTAGLAGFAGAVAPCMALWDMASTVELVFWSVPLGILCLNLLGWRMMQQVEGKIDDLDKARYKYKGA
ncbi:hypothetical protein BJV82DRAFT_714098 [Fennellomyces sp. T-0311]|nr:hypothetical protein BJV82DRAFT_714098 [Fennellomyces sp. T-0311]